MLRDQSSKSMVFRPSIKTGLLAGSLSSVFEIVAKTLPTERKIYDKEFTQEEFKSNLSKINWVSFKAKRS